MVFKGLGHHTKKVKEVVQKETDAILDCLKNGKDKIIGTGEYGAVVGSPHTRLMTKILPSKYKDDKTVILLSANRIPSLIGSADSHQITALNDGVMKQDGSNVQFMESNANTIRSSLDPLYLLNVTAKTLGNGKFGSIYKDGLIGNDKHASVWLHTRGLLQADVLRFSKWVLLTITLKQSVISDVREIGNVDFANDRLFYNYNPKMKVQLLSLQFRLFKVTSACDGASRRHSTTLGGTSGDTPTKVWQQGEVMNCKGTSKDTSGSSHYSVCSGDVTKTQQRDMSRSCANTTVGASKESNIHTRHAMQDLIKANNELRAAPV
nr:voltage-dependent anion channel [Tanacetum cinerariifolium]